MRAASIAVLSCLAACTSDDDPRPDAGAGAGGVMTMPGGGAGNAGTSGAAGASGSSGSGGAPAGGIGGSATGCPPALDVGARIVGRFDGCDAAGPRFAWSGAGLVARFRGPSVALRLKDRPNQYTVLIDGALAPTLETTAGEAVYPLADDLADAEHVLEVYRRTEASFGSTVVLGLEVEGGELLDPPAAPARHIEVVGDSISCGYGNEGANATCMFSAETENHYLTYGALLARQFEAELSTVAWSGKGVVSNYNGDKTDPMPVLYGRAVPNDAKSSWGFGSKAQAVIVNLGTNDYSTANDPTDVDFVTTYRTLLERIRQNYPDAFILCTVGPLLSGTDLSTARANIAAAVAARNDAGDALVKTHALTTPIVSPGCDYHPSVATHAAMAAELAPVLQAQLGW